ncbi:MAG: hypothetical protein AB1758_02475 [Candidatus Eremiobacterota bacterium]
MGTRYVEHGGAVSELATRKMDFEGAEFRGSAWFDRGGPRFLEAADQTGTSYRIERHGDATVYGVYSWGAREWQLASHRNGTLTLLEPASEFPRSGVADPFRTLSGAPGRLAP